MNELHDRRTYDPCREMIATLIKSVDELRHEVERLRKDVGSAEALGQRLDALRDHLNSAFPDGGLEGHRMAHEAMIAQAEERAELFRRLRIKAGEMTVWAFFGVLGALLVYYWNGLMPTSAHISVPK